MSTTTIDRVEEKALSIPSQAKALTVATNEDYLAGESLLASCKEMENEIHAAFDPIVEKAFIAHKEAVAQRKKYLDPIEEGRKILKQKMIAFQDEQERLRREEQSLAEEAARLRAEQEALEAAVAAEQSGDAETAEAIIAAPVQIAPVFVTKTAPAASRLSAGRTQWYAEGTDIVKLCKAIATGRASKEFVMFNMVALNKLAGAMKNTMNVDGVVAKSRKV